MVDEGAREGVRSVYMARYVLYALVLAWCSLFPER